MNPRAGEKPAQLMTKQVAPTTVSETKKSSWSNRTAKTSEMGERFIVVGSVRPLKYGARANKLYGEGRTKSFNKDKDE